MTDIIVALENEDDEIDELLIFKGAKTIEDVGKKIKSQDLGFDLEDCPLVLAIDNAKGLDVQMAFADVDITEIE